jgi:hypothetical protein
MQDLSGHKWNRLECLGFAYRKGKAYFWWFRCDCGTVKIIDSKPVKQGKVKSCGCLHRERGATIARMHLQTHGHALENKPSRVYTIWATMKQRCENPLASKYQNYGGRGILVCPSWSKNFERFLLDMGEPPSDQHQIERIDNNDDYYPENCRWATRKEQARNRRDNHLLTFQGKTATMVEWAEITGLRYDNIKNRINRLKWPVDLALTKPQRHITRISHATSHQ